MRLQSPQILKRPQAGCQTCLQSAELSRCLSYSGTGFFIHCRQAGKICSAILHDCSGVTSDTGSILAATNRRMLVTI